MNTSKKIQYLCIGLLVSYFCAFIYDFSASLHGTALYCKYQRLPKKYSIIMENNNYFLAPRAQCLYGTNYSENKMQIICVNDTNIHYYTNLYHLGYNQNKFLLHVRANDGHLYWLSNENEKYKVIEQPDLSSKNYHWLTLDKQNDIIYQMAFFALLCPVIYIWLFCVVRKEKKHQQTLPPEEQQPIAIYAKLTLWSPLVIYIIYRIYRFTFLF